MNKKTTLLLSIGFITLATTGAACTSSSNSVANNNGTESTSNAPQTVTMNDSLTVSDITYDVTSVEALDSIPADRTIEQFASIAEEKMPSSGNHFVHVTGTVTNNKDDVEYVDTNALKIVDADGAEYKFSTDVSLYVPSDLLPTFIEVPAGGSADWEAYFEVPTDATDLKLKATDLQLVPDAFGYITLSL